MLHLAGFIHGAGDYEGAIPVKLNIADFPPVTNQSVDTSEKQDRECGSESVVHYCYAMHVLYSIPHDTHVQIDAITMTIV